MSNNIAVSFVVPCYRSSKTIRSVTNEVIQVCKEHSYKYEIILVNDCSPDDVWSVIEDLCEHDSRIKGIHFSKNFGQASAVMAGYRNCSGDLIVTIDDDGQSPINQLPEMIHTLEEEQYDVVYGICEEAKFNIFRKLGSKVNAWMAYTAYGRPMDKRIVSINVIRRYVIEEVIKYSNPYTYLSGLVYRSTGNIGYCIVDHRKRLSGKSGYRFSSLLRVWMNGFTAFSIKPLQLANYMGIIAAFLGFIFGIITVVRKLLNPAVAIGWSSTISIMLFLGGVTLLVLGMIGEYVGRIYMCINSSPQYVISRSINIKGK